MPVCSFVFNLHLPLTAFHLFILLLEMRFRMILVYKNDSGVQENIACVCTV